MTSRSARIEVGRLLRKLASKIEPRDHRMLKVRFTLAQDDDELSWP